MEPLFLLVKLIWDFPTFLCFNTLFRVHNVRLGKVCYLQGNFCKIKMLKKQTFSVVFNNLILQKLPCKKHITLFRLSRDFSDFNLYKPAELYTRTEFGVLNLYKRNETKFTVLCSHGFHNFSFIVHIVDLRLCVR